ncbi:hypothetical protein CAPTEDRAFT_203119 [Capitella teleta]|uniref:Uncharacterized protein n=1 Tax=Capitella teleta TaxID=283909 RepID=R7VG98_CAPTE|nr:hypothetical protein CAPTEDRAFT_203119 [Capitella teleta]|eukprot:ELU15331.1 hypothetical protein CAPTEDRAFT_203119 [Capitella teleta]
MVTEDKSSQDREHKFRTLDKSPHVFVFPQVDGPTCSPTSFSRRSSTNSAYDEHAYMMAEALKSYQEYASRERHRYRAAAPTKEPPKTGYIILDPDIPDRDPTSYRRLRHRTKNRAPTIEPKRQKEPGMKMNVANSSWTTIQMLHEARNEKPGDWVRRVACCPRQRPATAHSRSNGKAQLSAQTSRSVDRIGSTSDDSYRKNVKFNGTMFSATRSPRKQYFTIHPEWVSENLSVQKMTLQQKCATYPPRRCKSAPPPSTRSRNPITWENWSVAPKR